VQTVAITPDGKQILSGSSDNSVRVWNAKSGLQLAKLEGHSDNVWSVAVYRGRYAISASSDGTIRLWDIVLEQFIKAINYGAGDRDNGWVAPLTLLKISFLRHIKTGESAFGASKRANALQC
jgi:WD40 repeat protein